MNDLYATFSVMWTARELRHMGFVVEFTHASLSKLGIKSARVAAENAFAQEVFALILALVRHRALGLAWHSIGYPGRFAALLCPREQQKALFAMRRDSMAFEEILNAQRDFPWWETIASRSSFNQPFVERTMASLDAVAFKEVPPMVARTMEHVWGGILQTKVCEDVNQKVRDHEQRDQASKVMTEVRRFYVPWQAQVLKTHEREEISPTPSRSSSAPSYRAYHRGLFHAPLQPSTENCELRRVMGKQSWDTFSPASSQKLLADLVLSRYFLERGGWERGPLTWRCQLLPTGAIIQQVSTMATFLSLGHVQSLCLLAWPLEQVINEHGTHWHPSSAPLEEGELSWLVVTDIHDWQVLPSKCVSPLQILLESGGAAQPFYGIQLRQIGEAESSLRAQAAIGFKEVDEIALRHLCDEEKVTPTDESKPGMIAALLTKLMPHIDAPGIVDLIMRGISAEGEDEELEAMAANGVLDDVV